MGLICDVSRLSIIWGCLQQRGHRPHGPSCPCWDGFALPATPGLGGLEGGQKRGDSPVWGEVGDRARAARLRWCVQPGGRTALGFLTCPQVEPQPQLCPVSIFPLAGTELHPFVINCPLLGRRSAQPPSLQVMEDTQRDHG